MHVYSATGNIIALIWENPNLVDIDKIILAHPTIDQVLCQHLNMTYIFNRDGSEAKQCGNGLRTLAFHMGKHSTMIQLRQKSHQVSKKDGMYWVNLGTPIQLPYLDLHIAHAVVDIGNLHLIIESSVCDKIISLYKHKYNISFVEIYNGVLNIKTYERGVGWTNACGSATAAATYVGYLRYSSPIWEAITPGGKLLMRIIDNQIWQTGDINPIKSYALL